MQTLTNGEVTYAGFWVRLAAFAIDSVVVGAGLLLVRMAVFVFMLVLDGTPLAGGILFTYTLKDLALYAFGALYYILCTYFTGTTPGKRVMNLRVVYTGSAESLPFLNVLYRETIGKFLNGFIPLVGGFIIALDKEKRGIHDRLSDTRVIYARKIKAIPVISKPQPRPQPIIPVQVDARTVRPGETEAYPDRRTDEPPMG